MTKIVYFHMGTGKTGSSALQSSFVQNKKLLEECNVIYPDHFTDKDAASGKVTSGNASGLAAYLSGKGKKSELSKLSKVLAVASKKDQSVLLSSEIFGDFSSGPTEELFSVVRKYGYETRCIYYVRSICGYALSSYSQRIKRHQYYRTFRGYVRLSFKTPFSRVFQSIETFGEKSVLLYNYDVYKEQIDEHFYKVVLGLPEIDFKLLQANVNRSMSPPELQLLRAMNKAFEKDAQSRFVSDALIYAFPNMGSRPRISKKDYEYVCEQFEDELNAINQCNIDVPISFMDDSIELCDEVDSLKYNHFQLAVLAILSELVKKSV